MFPSLFLIITRITTFKKSDDQTNIDKYRVDFRISYHIKIILPKKNHSKNQTALNGLTDGPDGLTLIVEKLRL